MIRLNDGKTFLWQWDVEQYLEIDNGPGHGSVQQQENLELLMQGLIL